MKEKSEDSINQRSQRLVEQLKRNPRLLSKLEHLMSMVENPDPEKGFDAFEAQILETSRDLSREGLSQLAQQLANLKAEQARLANPKLRIHGKKTRVAQPNGGSGDC